MTSERATYDIKYVLLARFCDLQYQFEFLSSAKTARMSSIVSARMTLRASWFIIISYRIKYYLGRRVLNSSPT